MESENQQEVVEQQEVAEQSAEQQEPEVKVEEKEPIFNIPSDLQGGEDCWLELPGPEVYANVFISRQGVLYGIQDRYTDDGVDKYLMKFDFANNKWHEVQNAKGIRKIRFGVNDELMILTDDCRLTIRTKTHLKVRELVADFGVSLKGRLHIIDLGDPASRGEEFQEWQSTDFASEYFLHPASEFGRVEVKEEDLIIARNNDKLDTYHECKAYNIGTGVDGSMFILGGTDDDFGVFTQLEKWDDEKYVWRKVDKVFSAQLAVHTANRVAVIKHGAIRLSTAPLVFV